jgi:hypothetical protein
LKSLGENVDNIYSVDSTVDKICCMLIESAKSTFVTYNSTKRINNCNVKLNIPWFGDECKHARKKYKTSKRRSKRFRTTTSINETKCLEKDDKILMNKSGRKHKEKMKKKIDNLKSTNLKKNIGK